TITTRRHSWPEGPTSDRNRFVAEHANRSTNSRRIRLRGNCRIRVRFFVVCAVLALACSTVCTPLTANEGATGGGEPMAARCEVELDIFSGMPNPTWPMTDAEADSFVKQVTA